jgi:hypothetical protein
MVVISGPRDFWLWHTVVAVAVVVAVVVVKVMLCAPVETWHAFYKSNCSVGSEAFVVENLKSESNATGECHRIHAVPRDITWARLDRSWDEDTRQAAATRKSTERYTWCRVAAVNLCKVTQE